MKKWIVAVATLAVAARAQADWQYTRWGMKPAQVIATSSGLVHAGSGEKSAQDSTTQGAAGTYAVADLTFEAAFYFDAKGLQTVGLSLHNDQQCLALQRDLLAKYGEPVEKTGGSVQRRMWADRAHGNRVALVTTDLAFCQLIYAPLISAAGAGL